MLEIPESHTIAEQLNRTIKGKTIQNVCVNSTPHGFAFYFGDPDEYESLLTGKIIGDSKAIAGQVEITVQDTKILFGDGVNIRYLEKGKPIPQKHQFHIEFEDCSSLVCTVQMYGGIWAFAEGENDNFYYIVAKEKPSPLTELFDESYFDYLLNCSKQTMSVKAFLATEQRIPGLGNGVLQDILFNARINPKIKINSLSSQDIDRLYKSVKQTLSEMTSNGGRDTEKDLFGCNGGYMTVLSKKTLNEPCPVCGGFIARQAYLGGNIYYCPVCQPIPT